MRRSSSKSEDQVSQMRLCADSEWCEAYPLLWEHLVETRWEDGSTRETSTLLLFAEDGRWKGCLNDRAEARSVFLAALTPEGVFEALEAGLRSEGLDWRAKPPRTPSRGGGGK